MRGRGSISVFIAALAGVIAIGGCGGGDDISYRDKKIVDKLNLEKSENGYSLAGDIFCEVKKDLLNDSGQVDDAMGKDTLGLVIASGEGNVGVEGVPIFQPDCKDQAKKKLNKLDPAPAD
jgi:hypothetical protein